MTARGIGSGGCALALLLLALATVFVFGGDRGRLYRDQLDGPHLDRPYGPCRPFCGGHGITRNHLAVAANLSPEHDFLGFYARHLNEDGEIAYEAYNRFPLGGYLLIKAAILPFSDDLSAQIRAARTLMLPFLAAAAVAAFLSLRRLTSSSGVALAATLLAFSSFYPLFFGDMAATEGSIDLFAVLLTFHGMVVFAQEGRFRQLLAKTCGALLVGWHVYGLLLPFIVFGLASEWRRGGGRGRARAARLVRSRHLALGAVALSFGLSVLAFNFAREHYALSRGGSHAPGGEEVTLAELPSFRSMVSRMGWDLNFNEGNPDPAWRLLPPRLLHRAGRASIPYVAEHGFWPRIPHLVTFVVRVAEHSFYFRPSPRTTVEARGRRVITTLFMLVGGIVVLCVGAGLAFVRHRVLLATLAASGFGWGVLAPNNAMHQHEGMFFVGLPLVFFSVVLLRARRVSERSVGVCAGTALLIFVLSGLQMGRIRSDFEASDDFPQEVADYETVRAVLPEGGVFLVNSRDRMRTRFFLAGRIFVDNLNGRQRHRADFVFSSERIPDGAGLLTPDNRLVFLYDRTEYDAQYVTLGDPVLEGGRGWRVHRVGNRLTYTTGAACGTGGRFRNEPLFFLDVLHSGGRLRNRLEFSFQRREFEVAGRCMTEVSLPRRDFAGIRTGQFVRGEGPLWSAEVPLAPRTADQTTPAARQAATVAGG